MTRLNRRPNALSIEACIAYGATLRNFWRRFRRATRWFVIAGWLLTGCGATRAYIDTTPSPDQPVVVVEGQQAGSYDADGVKVTWDSRRTGIVDRLFDVLFLGAAQGSQ